MKKLVAVAPGSAKLLDYHDRSVEPYEVKIEVSFASPKHGTEILDFQGLSPFNDEEFSAQWRMFQPRAQGAERGIVFGELPLGNMITGKIVEAGAEVVDYRLGDRVCTYAPVMESVIVNAVNNHRLRVLPAAGKWQNALCYDPAQFALSGVRDAHVRAGDYVVVMGLGAIGQLAVQLANKAGACTVIGVDPLAHRSNIALKHGADFCIDPTSCDVGQEIKRLTGKSGADSIIETSGNQAALQAALRGLAYGGTIAYVAFAKAFPGGLDFGREAHFNNAKIVFSRAASEPNPDYPRWDRKRIEATCWELLMNGYLDCQEIIDPIVPFEQCAEAYLKYLVESPELSIKLGVAF